MRIDIGGGTRGRSQERWSPLGSSTRETIRHQHQPRLPIRARDVAGPPGLKEVLDVVTSDLHGVICPSHLGKAREKWNFLAS